LRRRNRRRLSGTLATLIALLASPALAQTQTGSDTIPPPPDYGAQVFDAIILRPLGFTAAAVGAVLFVPAAILTSPGGMDTIEEAMEMLVIVPGEWVFTRPLGDF